MNSHDPFSGRVGSSPSVRVHRSDEVPLPPGVSVNPLGGRHGHVTAVIDISCPSCGRTDAVRKEGLGSYRCGECGAEFDQSAIEP